MMSNLPRPNWRIGATPSRPATTAASDIFVTLKSQIQGLQYWQLVESANTGSTCLVVRPNALWSTSSNCNVVIANAITGSTAYRSPDTSTNNSTQLQIGLVADVTENGSGSFKGANADRPFQSATGNPRWSGYWHCATTTNISASFILESEDVICVVFKSNLASSGTFGFLAGAIIETADSGSGENNYRNYGMITSGPSEISTTFWSSLSTFTSHNSTAANPHAGAFVVSGSQGMIDVTAGVGVNTWGLIFRYYTAPTVSYGDYATWRSGQPAGNRQVAYPIPFAWSASGQVAPVYYAGNGRGYYTGADDAGGLVRVQSGALDQVYKWTSLHNTTTANSVVFGPASGSGL